VPHPPGRLERTDVLVLQLVRQSDSLGLMLNRLAVHNGRLELLDNGLVDGVTLKPHQWQSTHVHASKPLTKSSTVHRSARSTTGAV
jgi:hypothetical protein